MQQYPRFNEVSRTVQGSSANFDESNPKYYCLCGSCHIVTTTKILLALHIVYVLMNLFATTRDRNSFFGLFILSTVIICTALALKYESSGLLWPVIVFEMIIFVFLIVGAVALLVAAFEYETPTLDITEENLTVGEGEKHRMSKQEYVSIVIVIEIVFILYALLSFCFLCSVCRCKQYFEEKNLTKNNMVFTVVTVVQPQEQQHMSAGQRVTPCEQHMSASGFEKPPPYSSTPTSPVLA